jgi:hypothetical protein
MDVAALALREGETAVYAVSLAGRVPPGAVARVELSFDAQRLRVEPSVLVLTGALAGSAQTVAVSTSRWPARAGQHAIASVGLQPASPSPRWPATPSRL